MAIYRGNNKIGEVFAGANKMKEVYKGSQLVYQGGKPSYVILTDNTKIDFDLSNTPIANFCSYSGNMIINGTSVPRDRIKEIVFGDSYSTVTSIPGYFLFTFISLIFVDLSVFANVASIGYSAFSRCYSLPSIDLSSFTNITSINHSLCMEANSLASINVGGISESKITDESGQSFQAVVPAGVMYADTLSIGNGYKQRFWGLRDWTVIVN